MNTLRNPNHRTSVARRYSLLLTVYIVLPLSTTSSNAAPQRSDANGTDPCREARSRLKTADMPEKRHVSTIQLAECLLSRATAPHLTAELLGDPSHRKALRAIVTEASALLESDVANGAQRNERASAQKEASRERVEMLRAFATTFLAMAKNDASESSKSALTNACIELAIYTDDPDKQIASAAKLWQAAAYRRAGRADRTLQMMWPALGRSTGSITDFFGRLERCRALTDAERYVAAAALAIKIEGKIDEWMIDQSADIRRQARRTAQLTRADVYDRWSNALKNDGSPERAAEAKKTAAALRKTASEDESATLTLDSAITSSAAINADAEHKISHPMID